MSSSTQPTDVGQQALVQAPAPTEMVHVEFAIPPSVGGSYAEVVGEFLSWVPFPMTKEPDGSFTATVRLEARRCWRYRFLIDGEHWMNDWTAEDYITNSDGSTMSLLRT